LTRASRINKYFQEIFITSNCQTPETDIHSVAADFMQICGPDVYMPASITISVSTDGENFTELKHIDNTVVKDEGLSFKNFGWEGEAKARYVRYQADADKTYGGVLFTDEIVVK
jgi:hexosaminidase